MIATLSHALPRQAEQRRLQHWFSALISEDTTSMEDLLAHGLPIDVRHPLRHSTALMEATRRGRISLVQWLLEHGASPVLLSGNPAYTPLHAAITGRQYAIARILLELLAHAALIDAYQRTPLHTLALEDTPLEEADALELAKSLIHYGCPLDMLDKDGASALHYCAINNHVQLATYLLDAGANANCLTPDNKVSPLTIAAMEGNRDVVRILLGHGADPHLSTKEGLCAAHFLEKRRRQLH